MNSRKIKGITSLMLIMLFMFQSLPAYAVSNISADEWIIHHEVVDSNGRIIEQVSEFAGSVFHLRITDDYIYILHN